MIGPVLLSLALPLAAPAPQEAVPQAAETTPAAAEVQALTWEEALRLAAALPDAAALRAGLVARAPLDGATSGWGNPSLTVAGGIRRTDGSAFTAEVEVLQPLPLSDRSAAAAAAAGAERTATAAAIDRLLLDARLEAARGWCALHGAGAVLEAAREEERLAEDLLDRASRAAEAGVYTSAELADLLAWQAEVRLLRLEAEREVRRLGLDLARTLRLPASRPLVAAGPLPSIPLPEPAERERLLASPERLPDVREEAARLEAARARLREAEAAAVPPLGIGASIVRDDAEEHAFLGILSFELPTFQRGQRERAQLAGEVAAARASLLAARSETAAAVRAALLEAEETAASLRVIEEVLLPSARNAARLHQLAFDAGEGIAVELLGARRTLLAAETRARLAAASHAAARYRLALLLEAAADEGTSR